MNGLRVAIVGGGVGGLTLAIDLRRRGIEVEVFEQADELTEIGAGIALAGNGTRVLEQLGLGDALRAVSVEIPDVHFRRWSDGEVIARQPLGEWYEQTYGGPFYTLHRIDLQRTLLEGLDPEVVRTGRRCTGVEDDGTAVRLSFENGPTADADVVIGADGVHSAVRRHLFATEPAVFSGTTGFRGLVPVKDLPLLPEPDASQLWLGPQGHLVHYPISGGKVINFLAVIRTAEWTREAWVEPCEVEETVAPFAAWHPAVVEMIGAVAEGARWALHDRDPLPRWTNGRVALLGDAAHAMLPHQGQGANQTLEDAGALAVCLDGVKAEGVEAALARYEALRLERTARVQLASREAADCYHLADGPEADLRDAKLRDLPSEIGWIHDYDASAASRASA